jgi:hypothetical protein
MDSVSARATIWGKNPQHLAKLRIGCTAAAKLGRNTGGKHIPLFEFREVLGDERVIGVAPICSLSEAGSDRVHQSRPVCRRPSICVLLHGEVSLLGVV